MNHFRENMTERIAAMADDEIYYETGGNALIVKMDELKPLKKELK